MTTLRFDPFSGASGDMILGALVDAGLSLDFLRNQLSLLPVSGYSISAEQVEQNAVRGIRITVDVVEDQPARTWGEIRQIIWSSALPAGTKETALAIFAKLAQAESTVHQQPLETVHFHEVGGVDAIVDICGAAIGFEALGVTAATSAPVCVGTGFVRAQHGMMPIPAPATAQLIAQASMPVSPLPADHAGLQAELLTPTGAAILATLATFESPRFRPDRVAYGFGRRQLPWPNALRIWLCNENEEQSVESDQIVLIEMNIDDMNPQGYDLVMERLFAAGVLDCWLTPVQMKKSRPGIMVSVLVRAGLQPAVEAILFAETTTIGIRYSPVERTTLDRREVEVSTRFGEVRLKLAIDRGRVLRARPEYEDCATLARRHGIPLADVWNEAHRLGDSFIGREASSLESATAASGGP